jgi:hypothetical protein
MRRFFASLRRFLAYTDLERMNLGTLAHQMIQSEYIPRLKRRLRKARTDSEKEQIEALISEFEKFSDPRTPESKIYDKTAANIVRTWAQRSRMGDEEMEDLMQQLAVDFFKPLRAKGEDLRDTMKKFDEMGGPIGLNKFWMHVVDLRVKYHIRETQRKYQEKTIDPGEGEEGEERDPISQIPAPSVVDEGYVRQVLKDLVVFMHKHLKKREMVKIFDRWMEVAQEKGAEKVNLKKDVFGYLLDKGMDANPATMGWWFLEVKNTMIDFLKQELGGEILGPVKRLLRVSSAEILAYEEFRRQFAAWMLGGILRGQIERA